jgi:hypothetical protein
VTSDEQAKEDRARFTVLATLAMFVILLPLAIVAASWYNTNQNRIEDNQAAIERERMARQEAVSRERELRNRSDWIAYDACVEGEARDAALVTALTQLIEPSSRPQAIIDLIDALEPAGEADCPIPVGARPGDLPVPGR